MARQGLSRRSFLMRVAAGSTALGLPWVRASEVRVPRRFVRLRPDIEPLVRWLERTPSDELLPALVRKVRSGELKYRPLLAALLLAGVRNVQPRPYVGYKFHTVLVIHSCHLAAIDAPAELRWVPLLWAAEYFKRCQREDEQEGDWAMGPVDEARVPEPQRARKAFCDAMDRWDEEAADAAVAGYVRAAGLQAVFEDFFRYAARDYRSIGHKAIFVANAYRTLQTIGPEHFEPVARSLAYALLNRYGDDPVRGDHLADRPWKENQGRVQQIRRGWSVGRADAGAVRSLVAVLRTGTYGEASEAVVDLLNAGVSPESVWDGLFGAAAELVLRQPGIVALHAVTTTNAIHQLYCLAASDTTRKLLLLQNAAFLPLFRGTMERRGAIADATIETLLTTSKTEASVEQVMEGTVSEAVPAAAAVLGDPAGRRELTEALRREIILRANDPHDYKLGSAVLEDFESRTDPWGRLLVATAVACLPRRHSPRTSVLRWLP